METNNEMDITTISGGAKAAYCGVISIMCGIPAWMNIQVADVYLSAVTKVVSVGVGIMAIRHYYLQDKKKKENGNTSNQ